MYMHLFAAAVLLITSAHAASFRNGGMDETDANAEAITGWYTPQSVG